MVRLKHRYLLVDILYPEHTSSASRGTTIDKALPLALQFHAPTPDGLTIQLLTRLIRDGVNDAFGEYGAGVVASSLQVKYLSPATSTAIVRVSRAHFRLVWAALTYVTRLPRPVDMPCVFQIVRVSGTIRKSEEEAIRRAKLSIMRAGKAGMASSDLGAPSKGTGLSASIFDNDNHDIDDDDNDDSHND